MTLVLTARFHSSLLEERWNTYLRDLPHFLKDEIMRYRRWEDRHCVLFGKLLLRDGLKRYRIDPKVISRLQKNAYGKPFIPGTPHFSISHSAQHIICAFHPKAEIGVDIEPIRPIDLTPFQSYMSDQEWRDIYRYSPPEVGFFRYWAIKESVIKADGRGLSAPLEAMDIQENVAFLQGRKWFIKELKLYPGMASWVACGEALHNLEICEIQYCVENKIID